MIGLYTALALAKSDPQMVAWTRKKSWLNLIWNYPGRVRGLNLTNGEIGAHSKTPVKLMTKYGVHAMNHNEMVIKATLAKLFEKEENLFKRIHFFLFHHFI